MSYKNDFTPEERKRHEVRLLELLLERGPCFSYELKNELNLGSREISSLLRFLSKRDLVYWYPHHSQEKDQTRRIWDLMRREDYCPTPKSQPMPDDAIEPFRHHKTEVENDPEHAEWLAQAIRGSRDKKLLMQKMRDRL